MSKRAFTLIELMIVVAIISLIAAVLIPSFLKARESARRKMPGSVAATPMAQVQAPPQQGELPDIESLDAELTLSNWSTRMGMDVTNRYRLSYHGKLQVALPTSARAAAGSKTELRIPFPEQTEEAMNVHVRFTQGSRHWEPDDWTVSRWGLLVQLPLQAGQPLLVEVDYQAQGRDRVVLALPSCNKLGRLHMQLKADQGAELAESSLQPQQRSASQWSWDFQNLVSQSPMMVDLPGSHSLTGKVLLLCRLAGLAVLLFGLGFWYVGELYRPGCLAKFGWGHFFMLAITYSAFFPALTVLSLGQGLPLTQALAIAAVLAQPLLILHVWRSVDVRFALLYVVPLADLTLAVVVNGVFGESWREPVFLGAGFLCVAFVTLTYPRWASNRQAWQNQQIERLQARIRSLIENSESLREQVRLVRGSDHVAALKSSLDTAQRQLNESDGLARYLHRLEQPDYSGVLASLESLERTLPYASQTLSQAQQRLHLPDGQQNQNHCLRCGKSGTDSLFCAHCGQKKALAFSCICGMKIWLPGPPKQTFYCPACGLEHPCKVES